MAKIKVSMIDIDDLKPHPRNSKKHPKDQIQKIARSIKNYGFNNPILIDASNTILAGHGRWKTDQKLNLLEVPVIRLEHLSESEARAFLIADNKTAESDYDDQIIAEELFDLSRLGMDGIDLGFDEDEMQKLINFSNSNDEKEMLELDSVDCKDKPAVSTGEIWEISGGHVLTVTGRKIKMERLFRLISESKEGIHLYLDDRQSSSLLAQALKNGCEVKRRIELSSTD